jgi:hypothetical protein
VRINQEEQNSQKILTSWILIRKKRKTEV